MNARSNPANYDAWYHNPRSAWMGEEECQMLIRMGAIGLGTSLLDVGCGSGWFTRRFAAAGCRAVGVDHDAAMLAFARGRDGDISYVQSDMHRLPFPDKSFDVVTAITSLCFVRDEHRALSELVRVARRTVLLGLLHRRSLLYRRKAGHGRYVDARWHSRAQARSLIQSISGVLGIDTETLLFWPGGPVAGRLLERLPWLRQCCGGFMAVKLTL